MYTCIIYPHIYMCTYAYLVLEAIWQQLWQRCTCLHTQVSNFTHTKKLGHTHMNMSFPTPYTNHSLCAHDAYCNTLQHTATHYNILQQPAAHCDTLQRTAAHCSTLQHIAAHCNTLQRTAAHCSTPPHAGARYKNAHLTRITLIIQCNTLQRIATHCTSLQ